MKLIVHSSKCVGHGRCYSVAPGMIEYDDDGYAIRDRAIPVEPDGIPAAREAVLACPQQAVELIEG
ncbi:MAG TPA: ferredoxin [Acidimicrobiales bacterium]